MVERGMASHQEQYQQPTTRETRHNQERAALARNVKVWLQQCYDSVVLAAPRAKIDTTKKILVDWLKKTAGGGDLKTAYINFGTKLTDELLELMDDSPDKNEPLVITEILLLNLTNMIIDKEKRDLASFEQVQPRSDWQALKVAEEESEKHYGLAKRLAIIKDDIKFANNEIIKAVKEKDDAGAEKWEAKHRELITQYAKEEKSGMLN